MVIKLVMIQLYVQLSEQIKVIELLKFQYKKLKEGLFQTKVPEFSGKMFHLDYVY